MSFISSLEIINAVAPDPKTFISITASVADIVADNHNGIKILLAKRVSTIFIRGKPVVINGLRKFKNPPSLLAIFIVLPFNKIFDLINLNIFYFIAC